ncbi:MAG: hypothetical protein HKP52_08240 [Desulfofustis sp.]|nr:hypothetical protein [Desulfofustis sp.]MBT8347815.1 hypothetical protein [Desulfofustis sp.]MBT8355619.1 hypothetical protein [Desulfofustis sp.]NNF46878.1 hypothetical protein [Desulfofustis sp.]NNK14212.1 hypothetical protein [Desulfofustis sp.]
MSDDAFDALIEQLQIQAYADARAAYGDRGFERWRMAEIRKNCLSWNPRMC